MRRGKNLWKQSHDSWGGSMCEACLFCIYPLSAAVCTVLFPRTPEHSRRPPSNPEPKHRGPTSTFCEGDALCFKAFTHDYTCLLDLGWRENKVPVWSTWGSTAPTTDAATFPTCSGRRVWFLESRTRLLCISRLAVWFLLRHQASCCASGTLETKAEHAYPGK